MTPEEALNHKSHIYEARISELQARIKELTEENEILKSEMTPAQLEHALRRIDCGQMNRCS